LHTTHSNYDRHPLTRVGADSQVCADGWDEVAARLRGRLRRGRFLLCVECYPGSPTDEVVTRLRSALAPSLCVRTEELFRPEAEIRQLLDPHLGTDPVFGRMNAVEIEDFFDPELLARRRDEVGSVGDGLVLVVGPGASLLSGGADLFVYAEMARWNIQQLQRRNVIGNLGLSNQADSAGQKYKRAFFVDWRSADRLKIKIFDRVDFLLDVNEAGRPRMISGEAYRGALESVSRRPFRVVPFFDPGPWGGQWMKRTFGLPDDKPNYAWCFDCVPEENSLRLGFGERAVEVPSLDLVLFHPEELLGPAIFKEFGAEFPIRFDFLDTMEGGNLSLQVHPLRSYIAEHFNVPYTQDESYYIMERGEGSVVYLGLREGVDPAQMAEELRAAQGGGAPFEAERFVNTWPSRKHDHFSVPGGTVHCSGRNNVVLEISATPYIFTFKLWDWGRLGLDGRPRPIHLDHGLANIQWGRTTAWVREHLFNQNEPVAEGEGWREERTGVHHSNFLETRRHWFTGAVPHDTKNTVNVLNLVEGEEAVVESPDGQFEPYAVHYAETFIVPASVGRYTVRPARQTEKPYATMKAFVRGAQG
jgi:mannose-6-phosphate isomerase class I